MILREERRDKERAREFPAPRAGQAKSRASDRRNNRSARRRSRDDAPRCVIVDVGHIVAFALSRARGRGGAKNGALRKLILGRTWCASASARRNGCGLRGKEIVLLLFLLVRRYVPAQDPIEQTLTPRDDVGAKKRERERRREGEEVYEEERVEREGETG